jgi:heptosyltransferase II
MKRYQITSLNPQLNASPEAAWILASKHGILNGNGKDFNNKILGLCPGAEYGEAKRWPAEYYAEVARHAIQNGWQVMLMGSDKDIPVTSQINQLTHNRCVDFGGKTKLSEAIDLMSLCDTVVSNDSGLMHIAAALISPEDTHKKLIAIFGSSDPTHTPPMNANAVIEYLGLSCSPCFERACPLTHLNCLKQITPNNIIQQIH